MAGSLAPNPSPPAAKPPLPMACLGNWVNEREADCPLSFDLVPVLGGLLP
jgi:hypothetical protein